MAGTDGGSTVRDPALDFVRVFCMFGIFLFHYVCSVFELNGSVSEHAAAAGAGYILVTAFFILSGVLMRRNHPRVSWKELPAFYQKRILSIYPSFYMVFLALYLHAVWKHGSFFYLKNRWTMILSVFGVDGYFSNVLPVYYQTGEWFLGAILILYLLYPLLALLADQYRLPASAVLTACFVYFQNETLLAVSPLANLFSCLISFWFGITAERLLVKRNGKRRILTVIWLFSMLISLYAKGPANIRLHFGGIFLFLFLYDVGSIAAEKQTLMIWIRRTAPVSFPFYLVHHVLVWKTVEWVRPETIPAHFIALAGSLMISLAAAVMVFVMSQYAVRLFRKLSGNTDKGDQAK